MQYFISFLEGIITFISPCLLPMLPVYISYFGAFGTEEIESGSGSMVKAKTSKTLAGALMFVAGFSLVFCLMGAFAGVIGGFLVRHSLIFNIVTGAVVVFFGIQYLDILPFNIFKGGGVKGSDKISRLPSLAAAFVFGVVFSIGWTPCVGAFLGSALVLASQSGSSLQGIVMLLCYSLGLGIPFIVTAVLLDKLTSAFNFIKKHYKIINFVCGIFLIIVGIFMMTGLFGKLLTFLSF